MIKKANAEMKTLIKVLLWIFFIALALFAVNLLFKKLGVT